MQSKSKETTVFLTGGLGNQLFELAAGLSVGNGGVIFYESELGKPRRNKGGQVQLECFELPSNLQRPLNQKYSWFLSKVYGYTLRAGFNPNRYESITLYRRVTNWFSQAIISFYLKQWNKLQIGSNVGFTELDNKFSKSALIGYFQSKNWIENESVFDSMFKLSAKEFGSRDHYLNLAVEQEPILLHVRLTDYTSEDSFGLLSESYFEKALIEISTISSSSKARNVWVFSDDLEAAKKLLNFLDPKTTTWFSEIEDCPVKTLEVMRMCSGYVISNSTYSWWAAALRYDQNSPVYFPVPWFKGAPSPDQLIPHEWIPVKADWRSLSSR